MRGQNKIIDDIRSSAKSTAASMIEEANAEKAQALAELRAYLDAAAATDVEATARAAEDLYAGQVKLGGLEAGKIMLEARQKCISAVYDGVRDKLLAAPDGEYLAILQSLIVSCCEDGDEIIASQSDSKRVTDAWVKKVSSAAKKKLTLSAEKGNFKGGVILRNKKFDRDLTLDEIIADLKERTISETIKKLGL